MTRFTGSVEMRFERKIFLSHKLNLTDMENYLMGKQGLPEIHAHC